MKFIYETQIPEKKLKFKDCEINQFFVYHGSLYQRVGDNNVNRITNSYGEPYADRDFFFEDHCEIERLIPIVKKIEY
jgi:hypothetical protein